MVVNPEYIFIISDPIDLKGNDADYILFLEQLSGLIWSSIDRCNNVLLSKEALESRVNAEHELLLTDNRLKAMTKTAQMIAHDIRRPLSALRNMIQDIAEMGILKDEVAVTRLLATERMVIQAQGITEDMIAIGRSASPAVERKKCSLKKILDDAATRVVDRNIVRIDYIGDFAIQMFVDEVKIERVFSNLLENAFHAAGESGKIWLRLERHDTFLVVVIGNSGSTIKSEVGGRIFDPFFTSGKKGGTGLGLAIAKSIVEAHHGKIWFESSTETGTEFFIELPLCNDNKNPLRGSLDSGAFKDRIGEIIKKSGRTLVIVEDDPFLLEKWQSLNSDWTVLSFARPEEFSLWIKSDDRSTKAVDVFLFDYFSQGQM